MSQPTAAPPIETDALRAALTRLLGDGHADRPIARLERQPSPYRSSYSVEELDVDLERGQTLRLVFKDLSPGAAQGAARPAFLRDPEREISLYRDLLAGAGLGTAAYRGAVVDAAAGRYWLFLERVPGWNLWQVGDLAVWRRAAEWLAELHGRFAGAVGDGAGTRLLRYDADLYHRWLERAREFTRRRAEGADRARVERVWSRYEGASAYLTALPRTLIHGEFFPSNVIVSPAAGRGRRICPVDWEMAGLGPGLIDLAALTAGRWTEAQRRSLVEAYRAALAATEQPGPSEFALAFDCCRLHVAVQWLGWSDSWEPPAAHAHDWLAEAIGLAEGLAL